MAQFVHQPSFAAGEISPELFGRIDQELYSIGLRTCRNFIVRPYGGVWNRPGTSFVAESKNNSKRMRLIPFQFNEVQTYCLEFGEYYMRVIKDGAEVTESAKTITGITAANPGVVTSAGHGFSNGDDVYLTGIVGMTQLNGRTVRVSGVTANTFNLVDLDGNNINTSSYTAYSSAGTASRIYTLTTPWTEAAVINTTDDDIIHYAQSNDVLTVCHRDYYAQDITRTGHAAWTIADFDNEGGPFKDINGTATTVYSDTFTGSVTLTASSGIFTSGMVGDLFYIEQEASDTTKAWEAAKNISTAEKRRAGSHYYQAETISGSANISAVALTATCYVTFTGAHGFTNGDYVFIDGINGTTELNGTWYYVKVRTSTSIYLQDADSPGTAINATSFTAWSSAGTAVKGKRTGGNKPDWTEGTRVDGDPGVAWTYLHSGFGIVQITGYTSATVVTGTVVKRLPDNVVGSGNATTAWAYAAWSDAEGYPVTNTYHKQRMTFGGNTNTPDRMWMSKVGVRTDFSVSNPVLDDEAIIIQLASNKVNSVRSFVPLNNLIALTSDSEQLISGNSDDAILATEPPSAKVQGYTGASRIQPLIINNTALFIQDYGQSIHSLRYQLDTDTFGGIDLTARSPHLFRSKKIIDRAYCRQPHSVIWIVQDDGSLLGFTFMEEQKVYAWHRHDTDGTYESVCCIREGDETATYVVVKRTINGVTKRYVERFKSRIFTDVRDAFFVDCGLTYDGRNTTVKTITVTGGTNWTPDEVLTLTASASTFASTDVGSQIVMYYEDDDGEQVRLAFTILTYSSGTVVTATPSATVPASLRSVAEDGWEFARTTFDGLWHLNGETGLVALADGAVVTDCSITTGRLTLSEHAAVVHVGFGFTSDIETLDMASPQGQSKAKPLNVSRVFITAQETSALFVGMNGADSVKEVKVRDTTDGTDTPIAPKTKLFECIVNTQWSRTGRVFVRNDKPLPIAINCITPEVTLGSG